MNKIVGQPQTIKKLNEDIIKNIIETHGAITKPEIAHITNLSLATVNKTVESLLRKNVIKVSGISNSTGGRRAQLFEIDGDKSFVIVLYYYNNTYLGAVSNIIGKIKYRKEFNVRTQNYEEVMEDTYNAIDALISHCKGREIKAIGIGVPGVVNNGMVSNIPNIPGWEGKNLKEILEKKYKYDIYLENDVNLTSMGIYYSKYKNNYKNMVLVYIGDGIGSGIIINKELFKGSTNFAGELSYLPTKSYFNNNKKTKYKGNFENNISILKDLIKENTTEKMELENALINTIADGLVDIICILNPELIVIQSKDLDDNDIEKIKNAVSKNIDEKNIPQIIKLYEEKEENINGVVSMCLRECISEYSVSTKRGGVV